MKKWFIGLLCIGLLLVLVQGNPTEAATDGVLTYYCGKQGVVITDCDTTVSGDFVIPNEIDGTAVVVIDNRAFEGCTGITSVTVPDSIVQMGMYAFSGCSNLKDVYISDLNAWCQIDFAGWYSTPMYSGENFYVNGELLTELTIPQEVTQIKQYAFYGFDHLAAVTIPQTVTTIGKYAFSDNDALTTVSISDGVTAIGEYAFSYCVSLTEVVLPDSVTTLGGGVFSDCAALTHATLPKDITTVSPYLFNNDKSLTEIVIPDGVSVIGDSAFADCSDLSSVTIPPSVTQMDSRAFYFCSVDRIYISDMAAWMGITFGGSMGSPLSHGSRLYLNSELVTEITVPEGITQINTYAFNYLDNITKVTLPEGLISIENNAFLECYALASVNLPEGLEKIGNNAFMSCFPLTGIHIPASVSSIGIRAFSSCFKLTKADLPAGLTKLGDSAFYECEGITSVHIPVGVSKIGNSAFSGCIGLKKVTIDEGVTAIGDYAFLNCQFTSIVIPASVTSIGAKAFLNCEWLKTVYFCGDAPTFGTDIFYADNRTVNAYYHAGFEGWTAEVKAACGKKINWVKKDHLVLQYTSDANATCTADSTKSGLCIGCGVTDVQTEPGTATGHSYATGICTTCGAADPDYVKPVVQPTLKLKYPTLTFEDVILMNVYFSAENLEDVVEMGLITYKQNQTEYSVDTAEGIIPGYTWSEPDGFYYATTEGIAAKDMGDELFFAIYAKLTDDSYVYSKLVSYSPKTYADTLLETGDPDMKAMVVAMLNYGAAAQKYFGYNTDAPVNGDLTAEQLALAEAYRPDMIGTVTAPSTQKQGIFVKNGGHVRRYPTVSFEGAFCINYYYTPSAQPVGDITMYYWSQEAYDAADVLTAENATAAIKMEGSGVGEYHAAVEGIAAKDLDQGVYVAFTYSDGTTTYYSGVLAYSIGTYCAIQASATDGTAELAKATAVYGYYAKRLFN